MAVFFWAKLRNLFPKREYTKIHIHTAYRSMKEVKMIATTNTYYDGHWYSAGQDIPDLGSFMATSVDGGIRGYEGLSKDIYKLPKYDDLWTGSSAFCVDTGQLFKYESTTKTWYEPKEGGTRV